MLISHEVDKNTHRNNKMMKKYFPITFLQSLFLWKTIYMVWNFIWEEGFFVFSDPMGIPYDMYESFNFCFNCWDHHMC